MRYQDVDTEWGKKCNCHCSNAVDNIFSLRDIFPRKSRKFSSLRSVAGAEANMKKSPTSRLFAPLLVATVGLPGRGKSLLARRLCRYLNFTGDVCKGESEKRKFFYWFSKKFETECQFESNCARLCWICTWCKKIKWILFLIENEKINRYFSNILNCITRCIILQKPKQKQNQINFFS